MTPMGVVLGVRREGGARVGVRPPPFLRFNFLGTVFFLLIGGGGGLELLLHGGQACFLMGARPLLDFCKDFCGRPWACYCFRPNCNSNVIVQIFRFQMVQRCPNYFVIFISISECWHIER